jgi:tRNA A-37 threonylcarbamoyl transferase component Bud32
MSQASSATRDTGEESSGTEDAGDASSAADAGDASSAAEDAGEASSAVNIVSGTTTAKERRHVQSAIGKFQVVRKLAEGATSTVFLGHDEFAGRDVAIKLVPLVRLTAHTQRVFRKLLLTEASLIGKLAHPHIVQIYDAVVEDRYGYIVMEYVPGGTLEQYCGRKSLLPWRHVVEIIFKCCRALEFACNKGVIHRDVKPANVLIAGGTDIKITDFGAALHATLDSTMVTGVGSPAYMSPEQVREEQPSHLSDIYALGVVMFQLLSGQLPYKASNHYSLMYQITHSPPAPLSKLRPDLPPAVTQIVERAMHKDRALRFPTWDAFSAALSAVSQTGPGEEVGQVADAEKFNALRGLPFFREFSDAEIWEAMRFSDWRDFPPERKLLADGGAGDFFCIIARGEVRVEKRGRLLNVLRPGDCFGEMAYLLPERGSMRGADVTTTQASRIVTIRSEDLRQASLACQHHFDRAFIRLLIARIELANNRLATGAM